MTLHLKKVVSDLSRLSEEEQNSLASLIREELSWKSTLKKSNGKLAQLAKEAVKEHRAGKTKSKGW